jgi:hypothetical protein
MFEEDSEVPVRDHFFVVFDADDLLHDFDVGGDVACFLYLARLVFLYHFIQSCYKAVGASFAARSRWAEGRGPMAAAAVLELAGARREARLKWSCETRSSEDGYL